MYSDSDVIAASLDDPDRFGEIYDRYSRRVFGYVVRRIPREDAADITGDIFLRAFRFRHKFDLKRSAALPWLLGIATNVIGEYLRKRTRRTRIGLRADTFSNPPIDDIATARADAARAWPALEATLGRLKPRDRSVLILFAIEDMSYQEISDALQVPVGTVRSRLHRARTQAGELLGASGQTPYDEGQL
ncbi:MAG: RNA polymerase sigma factor [bacterium]|nr:RNA polymerase sigma factor [bacterium]